MSALNVYCCRDGDYLLSPDCMQPSMQTSSTHGPIRFLGSIACMTFGEALCREIERQIDERMFALVAKDEIDVDVLLLDEHQVGRNAGTAVT